MKKVIALSQVYWPDTASVAQHLSDLMEKLANKDNDVNVISSQFNYENTAVQYKSFEIHNDVKIHRVRNTGFGKSSIFFRIIDFLTFNILMAIRLLQLGQRDDIVIGLTSPPLVSFLGIIISKMLRMKYIYWTMDLQPELSVTAGYLNRNSFIAKALQFMGDLIFRYSDLIIVLDKYMRNHVVNRGGNPDKISIIPVWPAMKSIYSGTRKNNPFRIEHNFDNKIVIMYSGNHSVVHPLDTLLNTAKLLHKDNRFLFVHIGGGVRLSDVKQFKKENSLSNIVIFPYQPRENIHLSLGSADLQVVILGEDCVGYTHPNKIYGSMFIGKPILYIGPEKSHVSDIINSLQGNISVMHGEQVELSTNLINFAKTNELSKIGIGENNRNFAESNFHPDILLSEMIACIGSV